MIKIFKAKRCFFAVISATVLMLFTALNLPLKSTTAQASSNTYDSFLTAYFDCLTQNYGVNSKGSCSQVAIGMLLSYYDTYLNDSIMPEQYDSVSVGVQTDMTARRNSPGIRRDEIANATSLSATAYYNQISALASTHLHAKLIQITNQLGYYNFGNNSSPFYSTYGARESITQQYLSSVAMINSSSYSLSYVTTGVRQFVIENIESDKPVFLSVSKNGVLHDIVAYDYDEATDSIYCHFGLDSARTHVTPESQGYTTYTYAMVLDFNLSHSHSNNYAVSTVENGTTVTNYYCYDSTAIYTYAHSHDYGNYYITNGLKNHKSYCDCGGFILEPHVVRKADTTRCIVCNGLAGAGSMVIMSQKPVYQTENGSYIMQNGIIVLADEDIEAYFNGSLVWMIANSQIK